MTIPDWTDMPDPQQCMILDWQDIYLKAQVITQKKFGRLPTKAEVKEIFLSLVWLAGDYKTETFWTKIEKHCENEYHDIKE